MTAVVQFKGYQGAVTYDAGRLLVRILHIDDFVSTECDRASDVQATFEELVDDYIETCHDLGQEPNRPFRGSFNVRVSPELHRAAVFSATSKGETLNAWVVGAIEAKIDGYNSEAYLALLNVIRERSSTVSAYKRELLPVRAAAPVRPFLTTTSDVASFINVARQARRRSAGPWGTQ